MKNNHRYVSQLKRIAILLVLFSFALYMIVDDELSSDAQQYIALASPTDDLENNVFIHLMALGDKSEDAYQKHKNLYVKNYELTKKDYYSYDKIISIPSSFLDLESLPWNMDCRISEGDCIKKLEENRGTLVTLLSREIELAKNLVLSQNSYSYGNVDTVSTRINVDGMTNLNFLIGLAVYNHTLENELALAETLLLNYFLLLRKTAEASSDIAFSAFYAVYLYTTIQPLFEELVLKQHVFELPLREYFYENPMREISNLKITSNEMYENSFAFKSSDTYPLSFCPRCNFNWGFMPNVTLNKVTERWKALIIPEYTKKENYIKLITQKSSNWTNRTDSPFWNSLKNLRNPRGEGIVYASVLTLDIALLVAQKDLNFLLFQLAAESIDTPVQELINKQDYIDPYTGNSPFVDGSKVCYPPWPELDDEDEKHEAVCIRYR